MRPDKRLQPHAEIIAAHDLRKRYSQPMKSLETTSFPGDNENVDLSETVKSLINSTFAELRISRGSDAATKRALLRYFQNGVRAGLTLDELIQLLFFKPTQTTAPVSRVGYDSRQISTIINFVKELTMLEVLSYSEG